MAARRFLAIALFALTLAPSGWFAWRWRDMAHLGVYHDDALYLVGAKSLAEGHGYRIENLPGQPFQTKYPPLFSALLAPLWKSGPPFPRNLPLLTLSVWLMLPAYLFLARATFRKFGFGRREAALLILVAALHPIVLLLGMSVMPDLLFGAILLACLWVAERALSPSQPAWLALAAGALGGAAFLTRTAALPILITAPLCFLLRRRWVRAWLFFSSMLPAVVGWQIWTSAHLLRTSDPVLLYYTNYLAMERAVVHWNNLGLVVWHNLDGLLRGVAKLIVFDVFPVNPHLQQVIGVAAIAGIVRLARRTKQLQYPVGAAGLSLLLLVYFFPADERILLPVYPLVLMGFWTEARNFASVVSKTWRRRAYADRAGAALAAAALSGLIGFIAASEVVGVVDFLPKVRKACVDQRANHKPVYDWIRRRTQPASTFYACDDALLYLYTGRRALGLPAPASRLYQVDGAAEMRQYALAVPRKAREHGLDYLLITEEEFYRDGAAGLSWGAAAHDPSLELECVAAHAAVYRMRDSER